MAFLSYRNSPVLSVGLSPVKIFLGRNIRDQIVLTRSLLEPINVKYEDIKRN